MQVFIDSELPNCVLVNGPNDELVRLIPSSAPMMGYFVAHFLKDNSPSNFKPSRSRLLWGTKDEIFDLLQAEWER